MGKSTDVKTEQFEKAVFRIVEHKGKSTETNERQLRKAQDPMISAFSFPTGVPVIVWLLENSYGNTYFSSYSLPSATILSEYAAQFVAAL